MNILTVIDNGNNLVNLETVRTNKSRNLLQWKVLDMFL